MNYIGLIMSTKIRKLIENIFSNISKDSSIPAELSSYLMKLQIPVIKMSDDKAFLNDLKHPARVTLELLKIICTSSKETQKIAINISKITDLLIYAKDITTNDFLMANKSLLSLINECDKNKLIKEYEAENKNYNLKINYDDFKQKVINELQSIISDNSIPILAHELTLKIWPQFMYKMCIEKGSKGQAWAKSIVLFKKIIKYIQPIQSIDDWNKINFIYKNFVESIEKYLRESDINDERISINVSALNKTIEVNLSQFENENKILIQKSINMNKKLDMLPKEVKVGEWYDLYTSENTAANRLKLSVIVKDKAQLVFVDHRGIQGMVKDASLFSEELSRFLSRPVNSKRPKFYDTWNSIVDKIKIHF